ncbi:hypothetical protein [Parasitella parasitica]|uniref:BP74 N-terminal domain-containing protein n=1 Tax=Parasitella parasitica TaxID=35722 RepID=A0A0B7NA40_9FUNG|nr:hypothetical protein [Parasitella parasitica]
MQDENLEDMVSNYMVSFPREIIIIFSIMFKLVLLLVATLAASFVAAETAYFAFITQGAQEQFVFELNDDAKIAHARRILSGEETSRVHVHGRILKKPEPYNPRYDFSLDPDTTDFFNYAIEVCDAELFYVEDHLDEVCGAFLPGCHYCPWTSTLTGEIMP